MTVTNEYDWPGAFPKYEEIFSSGIVERGVEYLLNARIPGEGWGILPGLPTELHPTSLAVSALFGSQSRTAVGTANGAATFVREHYGKRLDPLALQDICDLLFVSAAEQRPMDDDYRHKLASAAMTVYGALDAAESPSSTRLLCTFLIAVEQARLAVPLDTTDLIDRICATQRPDGGWPPLPQQPSSVVASAFAVRALMCRTDRQALDAAARGSSFLQAQLSAAGWPQFASTGGTFTTALILWALASCSDVEYRVIRDGIDLLQSTITSEGGWGDGPNEKPSIETTAICLLALTAAGENRFVPFRLAGTAVALLDRKVVALTNELDALKSAMKKRVQDECGGVVRERDRLLKRNEDLSKQVAVLARKAREKTEDDDRAQFDRYRLERELQVLHTTVRRAGLLSWRSKALAELPRVVLILGAIGAVVFLWEWPITIARGLGILCVAAVVAALLWRMARSSFDLESALVAPGDLRDELEMLRSMYADMSASWPPAVREELTYRLFTEFVEMPRDIGTRYAEELAMRIGLPPAERASFAQWVRMTTQMPPGERRLLFSQLERIILR